MTKKNSRIIPGFQGQKIQNSQLDYYCLLNHSQKIGKWEISLFK